MGGLFVTVRAVGAASTDCCVAGGGPAGIMLAFLLARQGVRTTLLEAHGDFDRDFRGDTIHPSTMEVLDQLGLADRLLELPHTKVQTISIPGPAGTLAIGDFRSLRTRFPFVTLMAQSRFLDFMAAEASQFPNFRLLLHANVQELVEEGGAVRGVRYRDPEGGHELRAPLTVAADGRFSKVRHLAGFQPIRTSPPMDVVWFRLPRRQDEPSGGLGAFGSHGRVAILLDRGDQWQVAYVIPKGAYQQLHASGIQELRRQVAEVLPQLADRVDQLTDWRQASLLSVESSRLRRWYKPGLLLIGDAAHVMSPVGGVGINYAIQDAVVAGNILAAPLKHGSVSVRDLRSVQRRRELPVRFIQGLQTFVQKRIISEALGSARPLRLPGLVRWPGFRALGPRIVGYGLWPPKVAKVA